MTINGRCNQYGGFTHWGRVTHICVSKLKQKHWFNNGLSPGRRQSIIWDNAGILFIWPPGTNFSELLIAIHTFSSKKMHWNMSSGNLTAILSRPWYVNGKLKSAQVMACCWSSCKWHKIYFAIKLIIAKSSSPDHIDSPFSYLWYLVSWLCLLFVAFSYLCSLKLYCTGFCKSLWNMRKKVWSVNICISYCKM